MRTSPSLTESERYLQDLCDRTFLSLWSHANVFRDQRIRGSRTDGKEICDLLVVFDNNIIMFSDKYCEFPDSGDLSRDWARWYRRAIIDSAKQLRGAERWIRQFPTRIYSDRACTQRFPIPLPNPLDTRFYRVVVAHGAAARCIQELGGSGSLMIDHHGRAATSTYDADAIPDPFTIGKVGLGSDIVHVFDDTTIDIVLTKLDTISDFVSYLDKKERLLGSGVSILAAGEEDLLAYYLQHLNEEGEHDFTFRSSYNAIFLEEGFWGEFQRSEHRREQIAADRISYLWDTLIELVTEDLNSTSLAHPIVADREAEEIVLRFLARESRFRRRMLARGLADLMEMADPKIDRYARTMMPAWPTEPYYLFMTLRKPEEVDRDDYREVRMGMLQDYCKSARLRFPSARDIIGIATEHRDNGFHSFDVIYLDDTDISLDEQHEIKKRAVDLGTFQDTQSFHLSEREYPLPDRPSVPQRIVMKGHLRNKPCPCGSGIKFKRGCGRGRSLST